MSARLPTTFLMLTMVLDSMGVGLIIPVMPDLIAEVQGVDLAGAAVWGGILLAAFAVFQFLCAPLLGNLADRFGRRPVLLTSLAVLAVDYVILALAGSIWLLILGRIIAGIAAGTYSTVNAMIADLYPPDERARYFGLVAACFGIGFVLGPAIGGLLGDLDPRAPFWAAAALSAANLVFGWLVLKETLRPADRRAFGLRRANPLGGLQQMRQLPGMGRLLAVVLIMHVANWVYPAIWAYYTQAQFGFDARQVGLSLTVYGIGLFVVQAILIGPILRQLGERRTTYAALVIGLFSMLYLSAIQTPLLLWLCLPLLALGDLYEPAMQGMMSRRAGADQQGELQGIQGSLQAVATIVSPLVMTWIFWAFTHDGAAIRMPGAPFVFAAVLVVIAFAVLLREPRVSQIADAP